MATDGTHVRMTVAQAAQALGISAEAVRQRVRRGTLPTEKSEDGSVFVLIDPLQYAERTRTDGVGTGDGTSDEALLSAHLDHALEEIRFLRSELSTKRGATPQRSHHCCSYRAHPRATLSARSLPRATRIARDAYGGHGKGRTPA